MKRVFLTLAVGIAIALGVYLRWQVVPLVRNGWLDTDVHRFVRQAKIIVETGGLPERDMMRWAPLGRDLTRQLSFSSYLLAWIYKSVRWIRPSFTLSDTALIYPLIWFVLSQVVLYFLVKGLFDRLTALSAVFLLAAVPSAFIRSSAGYADRDSLCLFLGLCVLLFFARSLEASSLRKRIFYATFAGIAQMFLNMSWEGSGLFGVIVGAFFLINVLWDRISYPHIFVYLGWAIPSILSLLLWTKTYYTLAPYALLAWGAPLSSGLSMGALFILRSLIPKENRIPIGILATTCSLLICIGIACALGALYAPSISDLFISFWDNIRSPLGKSRLMRTVGELQTLPTTDWAKAYGISFLLMVAGTLLIVWKVANFLRINPWFSMIIWLILIGGMVYSRFQPLSLNDHLSQWIFASVLLISGVLIVVSAWWLTWKQERPSLTNSTLDKWTLTLMWFVVMLMAARGASRYHFFFAPVAVSLLAYVLTSPVRYLQLRPPMFKWRWIALGVSFICFCFFTSTFARQSLGAIKMVQPTPSKRWRNAMAYMRDSLPPKSVVAAWWDHGNQINLLANQATIVDEDHFIPYWIHLMARHVFCAQDEEETLSFLRSHNASYLAIGLDDIARLGAISFLGSDENLDRKVMEPVYLRAFEKPFPLSKGGFVMRFYATKPVPGDFELFISEKSPLSVGRWVIREATLEFDLEEKGFKPISACVKIQTADGRLKVLFPKRVQLNDLTIEQDKGELPGRLIFFLPLFIKGRKETPLALFISEKAEAFLGVRLFLLGEKVPSFQRIYPPSSKEYPPWVGIWKIIYPPSITSRPEYLRMDFPNTLLRRSWQRGVGITQPH
jgi:asparagine N-glycosylation enzyme membrane subunit Stt3